MLVTLGPGFHDHTDRQRALVPVTVGAQTKLAAEAQTPQDCVLSEQMDKDPPTRTGILVYLSLGSGGKTKTITLKL